MCARASGQASPPARALALMRSCVHARVRACVRVCVCVCVCGWVRACGQECDHSAESITRCQCLAHKQVGKKGVSHNVAEICVISCACA
jgi:hypothetical protein